nr:MAG TPA: hypothetical protein [Caudoviricetes sp.]
MHLRIPYLRGFLEFSAFCCFLDRNRYFLFYCIHSIFCSLRESFIHFSKLLRTVSKHYIQ